jgi:hypothetical protein
MYEAAAPLKAIQHLLYQLRLTLAPHALSLL